MIEEWILILGVWYKSFSNQSHLLPFTGFFPCMTNTATRNQATDAFPRSRWCNCERDRCVYQCPHSGNWTVPGRSYPPTKSKACCCGADLFSCGLGWWYTLQYSLSPLYIYIYIYVSINHTYRYICILHMNIKRKKIFTYHW